MQLKCTHTNVSIENAFARFESCCHRWRKAHALLSQLRWRANGHNMPTHFHSSALSLAFVLWNTLNTMQANGNGVHCFLCIKGRQTTQWNCCCYCWSCWCCPIYPVTWSAYAIVNDVMTKKKRLKKYNAMQINCSYACAKCESKRREPMQENRQWIWKEKRQKVEEKKIFFSILFQRNGEWSGRWTISDKKNSLIF